MIGHAKPKPGARTYYYVRVSSPRQIDSDKYGMDIQLAACDRAYRLFAGDMPSLAEPSYIFEDVISTRVGKVGASLGDRAGGRLMYSTLRSGDHLIVAFLCRLGRSMKDAIRALLKLDDLGVTVWVADHGFNSANTIGKLMLNILAGMAQLDNESRALRRREAMRLKWETGDCTDVLFLPPGYRYTNAGRTRFEADEREMQLCELILEARRKGVGPKAIARCLQQAKIMRADGGGRVAPGVVQKNWTRSRVERAITDGCRRHSIKYLPPSTRNQEALLWLRRELKDRRHTTPTTDLAAYS